jgi:uncharacterized protein YyaL (SSP411 family)
MSHSSTATNALAQSASSYLRSAMHQPIQWHEWGEEAFAKAKQENKPILLDIGAVWCHWCHVMDRESYEDPAVAEIINREFIAIKVDRDERPDVDSRYQAAVQAISGQGGWPLTAFLTPDGRPFFGGTYFPPDEHWGRPGFKRVLTSLAAAYKEKHGEVMESAASVMAAINHQESFAGRGAEVNAATLDHMIQSAWQMFDRHHGGFGNAPKFPHPPAMDLAIDYFARTRSENLHEMITRSLEKMATGGVYDQLAGGFHRYSVDERWVVPHFEKMSYDNSELLKNYLHAWQVTEIPLFREVALDINRWVDEWLSDRDQGGFYASQDADLSMDDDGDYFTWTLAEAKAVLDEDELRAAAEYYDIGEVGEMHHNPAKNVLFVRMGIEEVAERLKLTVERVQELLGSARRRLYAARLQRATPYVDKTIYTGWNAMMVSAYLEAAAVFGLQEARQFALKSLDRVLTEAWEKDAARLQHVIAYSDPKSQKRPLAGSLDDYAFTVSACLDAYALTADLTYFRFAHDIANAMLKRFADNENGGFFDADASTDPALLLGALTARRKPLQDAPTPAGNPAAAIALLKLHELTNDDQYRASAESTLKCFAGIVDHFGIFAGTYGIALRMFVTPHTQVVIVGADANADLLHAVALKPFFLTKSVIRLRNAAAENLPPALAQTIPHLPEVKAGKSCAVICSGFACQPAITAPSQLEAELAKIVRSEVTA